MALTPLGVRTLEGFKKRYGPKEGEQKFRDAIAKGLIDGAKMETGPTVIDPGDGDSGPVLDASGAIHKVTAAAARGNVSGVDTTGGVEVPPNPTTAGKRRVPHGLARNAGGSFQARPG